MRSGLDECGHPGRAVTLAEVLMADLVAVGGTVVLFAGLALLGRGLERL